MIDDLAASGGLLERCGIEQVAGDELCPACGKRLERRGVSGHQAQVASGVEQLADDRSADESRPAGYQYPAHVSAPSPPSVSTDQYRTRYSTAEATVIRAAATITQSLISHGPSEMSG